MKSNVIKISTIGALIGMALGSTVWAAGSGDMDRDTMRVIDRDQPEVVMDQLKLQARDRQQLRDHAQDAGEMAALRRERNRERVREARFENSEAVQEQREAMHEYREQAQESVEQIRDDVIDIMK